MLKFTLLTVLLWCSLGFVCVTARTLEIWHSQDLNPQVMQQIGEQFNQQQDDIKVSFLPADVLMLSPSTLNKMRLPAAIMLPSDKLAVEGFNFKPLNKSWLSESLAPEFAASVSFDGRVKGVPVVGGNQLMMYYNKRLIKQPAQSWQQLVEQQKEVQAQGAQLMAFMCDSPFFLLPFLHAFDGGYYVDGKVKLDTPQNLTAMDWYQNMWKQGIFTTSCDHTLASEGFASGKLAYWLSTDSMYHSMGARLGEDLGMTTLPSINGKPMGGYFSTVSLAFPNQKFSEKQLAGLRKLAEFLQTFEVQKTLFQELRVMPVHERIMLSADLYPSKDFVNSYLQLKKNKPMPSHISLQVVWKEVANELRYFMRGAMTPEKFLSRTQRNIDRELKRMGL